MAALTEEAFRELVNDHGVLRPGTLASPDLDRCYAVFSQRPDARLDVEAIKRQAERFFTARVGITVDKHYDDVAPEVDAARFVIAGEDGTSAGTRLCYGRAIEPDDLSRAEQ